MAGLYSHCHAMQTYRGTGLPTHMHACPITLVLLLQEADPDPDGAKLASTPEPLKEASKLVASLKEHAAGLLETQLLALQVRKGMQRTATRFRLASPRPFHAVVPTLVQECSKASLALWIASASSRE
eukprot:1161585-Pelagomonas_calceolata.AAC.11